MCLEKALSDAIEEEDGCKYIAVHIPDLATVTEFDSINEIIDNDDTFGLSN